MISKIIKTTNMNPQQNSEENIKENQTPKNPGHDSRQSSHGRPQHQRGGRQGGGGGRGGFRRQDRKPRFQPRDIPPSKDQKPHDIIPPLAVGDIRIVPLGGVEEIGKNMTAIEIGEDIIVIDAGFQFREENTPGIDYILPNTKYLEERKSKIRGIIITHGHLDHIGAIPYIVDRIGNPPIYSRLLTTVMIRKRQEEFAHLAPLDVRVVEKEDRIMFGQIPVRFFGVSHTIPDSMGIMVETPYGLIVHTGDLKLDNDEGVPTEKEEDQFAHFKKEKVLVLLSDSTNVENPGFSTPEKLVFKNIEDIIKSVRGRLIIGTFSSQLERIIFMILAAEKHGKKIVIEGRSMKTNIEIAKQVGLLKVGAGTIIGSEEMESYPPDRIVCIATGAQGDEFAALMRMSQKTHKHFKVNPTDTVLLSSSVIPGNERAVQKLKDNLSRQGAHIIHNKVADVHSSGHANRDETLWIHQRINPKFFIPIHGYHYMLRVHAEIELSRGTPEKNIIIPDNGSVIEIREGGEKIVKIAEAAPSETVMVDGFSIGDIQEVVIRDRQMLGEDGMFLIVVTVNPKNGKLRKSPDIVSRGFVYVRESHELFHQTRMIIKKTVEDTSAGMNPINFDYVRGNVTDAVSRFLFQKTNKRPIVIPVIIGV